MADTGEDREIRQRQTANEVEEARESKELVRKLKQSKGYSKAFKTKIRSVDSKHMK